jgi:hypothetical protein
MPAVTSPAFGAERIPGLEVAVDAAPATLEATAKADAAIAA